LARDQVFIDTLITGTRLRAKVGANWPTLHTLDVRRETAFGMHMNVPMLQPLRVLVRRIRARLGSKCIILLYHRIADVASDPYVVSVSPQHFEEQLQVLRTVGNPMPLGELARRLATGKLPERAVCVTFDDGYQDNLYTAKPLLERYEIPATVFMTTGDVGRTREFWWDELASIFMAPGTLPDHLHIEPNAVMVDLHLGSAVHLTESDWLRYRAWTVIDDTLPTPRHAAFQQLYVALQKLTPEEQTNALERLQTWAGRSPSVRASHRALGAAEVAQLEAGGLVEIGAHSVNHAALSLQPASVQRAEIAGSRATLEEWLGHPISTFAYPYGLYSDVTVAEVRRAGFERACACLGHPVRRDSDRYLLPRIDVPDGDGDHLARELHSAFGG
jgi:peptidoglycan/xylan/chitin deacetylase (PgdA/CDA1 family)